MIGCIKAISPCVKSASAKLFLDLHTVLAPSGEERPLNAAAQVERARWCCRRFDSDTQTRCGSVTALVLVSSASGPRVSGCIRAPLYFHPYPVDAPRGPPLFTLPSSNAVARDRDSLALRTEPPCGDLSGAALAQQRVACAVEGAVVLLRRDARGRRPRRHTSKPSTVLMWCR